jgi:uncharacterized protein DUF1203
MAHSFQLVGIDPEQFEPLFQLPHEELKRHGAMRQYASESPGYPCRVSLQDAEAGEELLLLPYLHQPAASPYRASGPIYVRRGAKRCTLEAGDVPSYVTRRLMSVRAYDGAHMMVAASVSEGTLAAQEILRFFENPQVSYIHLHNAKRGCFSCRVDRV